MYVGNYDFWYESSQLMQKLVKDQNKRAEQKIQELQTFIARFSANKSKSRQATSRRKLLEKISVEDMPASSRRYPWVGFKAEREPGKDRLFVTDISKTVDGAKLLNHVSFIVGKEDKIAILGKNELAVTMLFKILMGDEEPDEGTVKWGVSTTQAYFPKDHNSYFENCDYDLIDWMRQFSTDKRESYLRTFLGRMLFSGDDVYKQVKVLSGGEKVRCMISKMMLSGPTSSCSTSRRTISIWRVSRRSTTAWPPSPTISSSRATTTSSRRRSPTASLRSRPTASSTAAARTTSICTSRVRKRNKSWSSLRKTNCTPPRSRAIRPTVQVYATLPAAPCS